jgi:hypothetical protein
MICQLFLAVGLCKETLNYLYVLKFYFSKSHFYMITKLNLSITALCLVAITVVYAQKERLLLMLPTISKGATMPTTAAAANPPTAAAPTNAIDATKQLASTTDLSAMLQAFDRILGLNEEQKNRVVYENEKAFERIASTRLRTDFEGNGKKLEVERLKKFRDKCITKVLNAEQIAKWENFQKSLEAIQVLKIAQYEYPKYQRGELRFYPESEYSGVRSLEQLQHSIDEKKSIIKATGFNMEEILQLQATIYNFN